MTANIFQPPAASYDSIRSVQTVEEMAAELRRLERSDPLVRHVADFANMTGMTPEEHRTMLAYYALRSAAQFRDALIERIHREPNPPFVIEPGQVVTIVEKR